ncbi:aspartate dehydrogenase [Marinitoga aeolica]|uniref:L-aspartate dehydrogenase n=1 Tax=Marinitoga aeolica TaxID=2809031 RepID=A0ABY8PTG5_9BACT|nr:aspartate dehydrogenase [Marinitoga aeolica]WGS65910.1 aspartate dehydrogenase [Marinitoga aeolica]
MKLFFLGGGNSAKIILEEMYDFIEKAYIYDKNKEQVDKLKYIFDNVEYKEINQIKDLEVDYVIEVASVEALKEYGLKILDMNKDLIVLSTGAFADKIFRYNFVKKLNSTNNKVYVVSGAIGGIDLINAIYDKIEKITLTTRKPPKSLGLEITEEKIIFEGNSIEAIERFPKNVNVAVTLSLAARNFEKVEVRIIADPKVERNIHTVEIISKAGNYKFEFENFPSKNPKTSYLAPLSIVGLLKNLNTNFRIGG